MMRLPGSTAQLGAVDVFCQWLITSLNLVKNAGKIWMSSWSYNIVWKIEEDFKKSIMQLK